MRSSSINWKKGGFRLYIVASFLFLAFFVAYFGYKATRGEYVTDCSDYRVTDLTKCKQDEIEWKKEAFSGQMIVTNPGAKMGCGCGSSFMYDFDEFIPTNS